MTSSRLTLKHKRKAFRIIITPASKARDSVKLEEEEDKAFDTDRKGGHLGVVELQA